jgi:hypothetical protein
VRSGAVIYGFADIPQIKTMIREAYPGLLDDKNAVRFVDKSDYAVFGVYRNASDEAQPATQSYFFITRGDYPVSSYNFALTFNPNWEKVTIDGKKWWRQGAVALTIGKTEAYIRIGRLPENPAPPSLGGDLDAFFAAAQHEHPPVFSCYVPSTETTGLIRRLGIPFEIPLQNITLTARTPPEAPHAETAYRSTLSLKTRTPSEAKALSAILSLARATIANRPPPTPATALFTGLLFANPPALNGDTVIIPGTLSLDTLIHTIKNR